MLSGTGPSPLPPRRPRQPNNRKPLTSALPTRASARQTPIIRPKPNSYTFVNAYENTAAPAAVGQKRAHQPIIGSSPYNLVSSHGKIQSSSPRPQINFYRGLRDMILPLSGFDPSNITSNYGPRTHPITGRASNHTGMDLSGALGTPILAAANGMVMGAVQGDPVYGNQIILGHGRNKNTMYGHMDKFNVKEGQKVRAGDVIGYVGSTGMSTGPHLHWETWAKGQSVNPMVFLGGS